MGSRIIQVFEFERLTLHPNGRGESLSPTELNKLYEFNDKNGNDFFTGIRDGIRFKHYVGVIQIGSLTIEILPKTDRIPATNKEDYNAWHDVLLDMLRICKHIKTNAVSNANLRQRHFSILEIYFEMFLDEVQQLVRRGLIKQYRQNAGNVLALKGKLDFNKNVQQNLIHQERFYTQHTIYDQDNLHNQILNRAINILNATTNNVLLKDKIANLKLCFADIAYKNIQAHDFLKLKSNRKTVAYDSAIQMAKMIILNYAPDIRSGQENMLTLLFDMNKLWEQYIYQMLLRTKRDDIKISPQNSQKFWQSKTIRPDIVIKEAKKENPKTICIIDTKWKVIDAKKPSDSDLKQMYAYNMYWESPKSILLYPNSNVRPETFGKFWKGRPNKENKITNHCKVAFINVLDENNKLDFSIGKRILLKI